MNRPRKTASRKGIGGRPRLRSDKRVIREARKLLPSAIKNVRAILDDPKAEPRFKLRAAALVLEHASRVPEGSGGEGEGERVIRVTYGEGFPKGSTTTEETEAA